MRSRRLRLCLALVLSAFIGCNGPYNSGDRVLVEKFAFDAGIGSPRRFEVVVFKFPPKPVEGGIPKNYIKRLLGLPGEILAIFFGQIFTFHPDADEAVAFEDKDANPNDLWKWRYMHVNSDGLGVEFKDSSGPPKIRKTLLHSPAEKAGLSDDDIITQVGAAKVSSVEEFWKVVHQVKAGTTLVFKVQRGADRVDVNVTIGPDVLRYFDTAGKFKIVRKPPDVMLAMRRIVNDNDFQPSDFFTEFKLPGAGERSIKISKRWEPSLGSGWLPDDSKGFVHAGDKQEVDWLRYQNVTGAAGFYRFASPEWVNKPELINDFMDYNFAFKERSGLDQAPQCNWVGSLMSECRLSIAKPEGEFRMELSRSTFRYQARFDLASGECSLFEIAWDDSEKLLGKAPTRVKGPGEYNLRLANFDARLTLWVDEDLPFGEGQEYPSPVLVAPGETVSKSALLERRGPTRKNDLERPASFGSRGAGVKIHHLRVWRDTYYSRNPGEADFADKINNMESFWRSPEDWGQIRLIQPKIMYVQPGHYLCLGDNSPMSSDSRAGADEPQKEWGLVPQRLMLGRALMVYYPLNRAGPIR